MNPRPAWKKNVFTGSVANLGFDLPNFEYSPQEYVDYFTKIDNDQALALMGRYSGLAAEKLLGNREIFVLEGSRVPQALKGVRLSTVSSPNEIIFDRNRILVVDNDDFRAACEPYLAWNSFRVLPCNILTVGHICCHAANIGYFSHLHILTKNLKLNGKDIVLLSMCKNHEVLGSILFLMGAVDSVGSLVMSSAYGRNAQCHFGGMGLLKHLHRDRDCCLVPNDDCSSNPYMRNLLFHNTDIDYHFLFGRKRKQNNATLFHRPFLLWMYPYAGSARANPVMRTVLKRLGFFDVLAEYFTRGNRELEIDIPYGANTYTGDALASLLGLMTANSYLWFHGHFYEGIEKIVGNDIRMLSIIRDYRDVVTSLFRSSFQNVILRRKGEVESLFLKSMDGSLGGATLGQCTKNLVDLKSCRNAVFLRFEDLNVDPVGAYVEAFRRLGLVDDPFWVDDIHLRLIREIVPTTQPPAGRGVAGAWKQWFTPAVRDYFKAHDSGILRAFGYEEDDSW